MKMFFIFFVFYLTMPMNVMAMKIENMEDACNTRSADFKKDVYIEGYSINTILSSEKYGFYVRVLKEWFKVVLRSEKEKDVYRDQFSSTARMANVMGIPVNVCLDRTGGGYLLDIEILSHRPTR